MVSLTDPPQFSETPKAIQFLIIATCLVSIIGSLVDTLFLETFTQTSIQYMLSLSWEGLAKGFLWEPLSYLFIQQSFGALSWSFFLTLIVEMYILWMMGTSVWNSIGTKSFLILYLGGGITAGLVSIGLASLIGVHPILAGSASAIYALLVFWTQLYPDVELFFFFLIHLKAKYLLAGILGIIILISLSQSHFINALWILSGSLYGYLYGLWAWQLKSPFVFTHPFDAFILKQQKRWQRHRSAKNSSYVDSKIIDFQSGQPLSNDQEFVDAMLTKISQQGEKSLTPKERKRLDKISTKRK